MTPEEKAKKLIIDFSFVKYNQEDGLLINNPTLKDYQKQCALIAIEQEEKMFLSLVGPEKHFYSENQLEIWNHIQQTKTEIKKNYETR